MPSGPTQDRVAGVVVAAGRGERFGGALPKQFEQIAGVSLVARAVEALASHPQVEEIVVVIPPGEIGAEQEERLRSLRGVVDVVGGGASRASSVRRGLERTLGFRHVLVHDAARPLASARLVDSVIAATLEHGAAVPALPIPDTVKEDDGSGWSLRTLDRTRLRLAQTPQGARTDWLVDALDRAAEAGLPITDEASALEQAGYRVRLVAGEADNVKITTREDLARVRAMLGGEGIGIRVGTGFDIHRFGEARTLVLGGVSFPGEPGLHGHSDADVVLHAAMDALLGAAALGDIGTHFPPTEPRWADARSTDLARIVARMVAERGYEIANVDLTVLAERPRILPRSAQMREAIAACLGLGSERVSLKATTLEGLGSLGRAEGIACQAAALLVAR